jgi:hypothetical protein
MANNRIYYAIQQVSMGPDENQTAVHGLQSVGITTNFNLEQIFELGQLALYQNVENIPEIEVTLNKVLDGYPLLYCLATELGTGINSSLVSEGPDLAGRQNARVDVKLGIFADTKTSATGTSISSVVCSGMYVSSVSYTFPVEGNFTEDLTLVGNDKIWGSSVSGLFPGNDDEPLALEGVNRRQHLDMDASRFPKDIPGIGDDGINELIGGGSGHEVHFQNVTVSTDLGREAIFELGTFKAYHRYVTFPVEVTSEFEVLAVTGDGINASEEGYYTTGGAVATGSEGKCEPRFNLLDQTIYLQTCEGTKIHLGNKNKLSSVNYTGGDTGGGNVTVTYSYSNFNDFVVAHSGAPLGGVNSWYDQIDENGWDPVEEAKLKAKVVNLSEKTTPVVKPVVYSPAAKEKDSEVK